MIDVKHIAKLARLGLSEQEEAKFGKDLASILDFVKTLEKVDVADEEPTAQATGLKNVLRPDEAQRKDEERRQALLANAPQREGNYIKVKAVFE